MSFMKELTKGIVKENPTFVIVLGMCPTLATTTSVNNAIGMGLAATFVLVCSNIMISLIRKITPDKIRIPVYVIVIAATIFSASNAQGRGCRIFNTDFNTGFYTVRFYFKQTSSKQP